jgi:hypothetical protein
MHEHEHDAEHEHGERHHRHGGFGPRRHGGRGRGFGRPGGWQQADLPPADGAEAWLRGRLPDDWFTEPPTVTIDREEIVVVGELPPPADDDSEATIGDTRVLFTNLSVPVMTRLRQTERRVLDTLVDAGVARSRSEALAWCVRLVGEHTDDWLASLRTAMSEVDKLRAEGPDLGDTQTV